MYPRPYHIHTIPVFQVFFVSMALEGGQIFLLRKINGSGFFRGGAEGNGKTNTLPHFATLCLKF